MVRKRLAGPTKRGVAVKNTRGTLKDRQKAGGYAARAALDNVLFDVDAPATARVSAARALAEMDGQLGKHQIPPERTADRGLSRLSREDLVTELGRLRALFDLGAFP